MENVSQKCEKKVARKALKQIQLNLDEMDPLLNRIESRSILDEDYITFQAMAETIICLGKSLQDKEISIRRLLKMLFGHKTEKRAKVLKKKTATPSENSPNTPEDENIQSNPPDDDSGIIANQDVGEKPQGCEEKDLDNFESKPKGHGRNGADAFTGAEKEYISHPTLEHGGPCPLCPNGKTYKIKRPSVTIRFSGASPVQGTVYELEKLRCNLCGEVFTAETPDKICGCRHYDESAKAAIPIYKYGCGMPFNRISDLQKMLGIPLSPATLWEKTEDLANIIFPVYKELVRRAAQGNLYYHDDTTMPILSLIKENEEKERGERTGMFTTAIVSVLENGKSIVLFNTGRNHAGENLDEFQKLRDPAKGPPIQMCDASSRNTNEEFERIVAHCLAHARRSFVDIIPAFPDECTHLIDALAKVYKNDAIAKEMSMSDGLRLVYHQKRSASVMEDLHIWLNEQFDEKLVEPNSSLGKAISYMLKYWKELTVFLRVPGAPLDNNICEQALKLPIRTRKNALFYKNEHGAIIGDIFMGFIHTCKGMGINPLDYMETLQIYKSLLRKDPSRWMPWNFKATIAELKNQ